MARKKDWNLTLQEDHDNYTQIIDVASATVTYIGKALPGSDTTIGRASAIWQIKKFDTTTSTDQKSPTWAAGDDAYNNIWNNRAALVYS